MWLESMENMKKDLKRLLSSFVLEVSDDNDEKSISSGMNIMYGG